MVLMLNAFSNAAASCSPERRCCWPLCSARAPAVSAASPRHNGRERLACASPETHPPKGLGEHRQHREGEPPTPTAQNAAMTHFAAKYGATLLNLSKCDVAAEVRKLTRRGRARPRIGDDRLTEGLVGGVRQPRNEGRVVIVGHAGEMPFDITKWLTLKGATIKGIYGCKVWDTSVRSRRTRRDQEDRPLGHTHAHVRLERSGRNGHPDPIRCGKSVVPTQPVKARSDLHGLRR